MPVPPNQLIPSVVEETSTPLSPDAEPATLYFARGPYRLSSAQAKNDANAMADGQLALDMRAVNAELKRLGYGEGLNAFTDLVREAARVPALLQDIARCAAIGGPHLTHSESDIADFAKDAARYRWVTAVRGRGAFVDNAGNEAGPMIDAELAKEGA